MILVPFFGTLIYLIARPAGDQGRADDDRPGEPRVRRDLLDPGASRLQVRGRPARPQQAADGKFEAEKARILTAQGIATA